MNIQWVWGVAGPFVLSGLCTVGVYAWLRSESPNFHSRECYFRLAGLELAYFALCLLVGLGAHLLRMGDEVYWTTVGYVFAFLVVIHWFLTEAAHSWARTVRKSGRRPNRPL